MSRTTDLPLARTRPHDRMLRTPLMQPSPPNPLHIRIQRRRQSSRSSSTTAACLRAPSFPDGLALREARPARTQLVALARPGRGGRHRALRRGHRLRQPLPRGSWVNERVTTLPAPPALDQLPISTRVRAPRSRWKATPFWAIATPTGRSAPQYRWPSPPQSNAYPASSSTPSSASGPLLLPRYPNVDDVVGLAHTYGCGVAIDAPDAVIPSARCATSRSTPTSAALP